MAVTTYRYDKVIKSVEQSVEYTYAWGMPQDQYIIIITWAEQKYRTKKIKPMMGDDYTIGEYVTVERKEQIKFTQAKFDELTALIGKPMVRHSEDPLSQGPKD